MVKHYHFIGIGGIGMGTLAKLLLAQGHLVSGSDVKENAMTTLLKERGAKIFIGHEAKNIEGAQFVVFSTAITEDNPERTEAQRRGVLVIHRAQLLAELMENHIGITVAGAHGKTTTTSMISHLLIEAGLDPTTAVGGLIRGAESYNAEWGSGKHFVAEVDESDGSFLHFKPNYSIITNVDFEHVDFYHNWNNILDTYSKFIERTNPSGTLIVFGEDHRLLNLVRPSKRKFLTYGLAEQNDSYALNIRTQGCTTKFDCYYHGKLLGTIQLIIPGHHNVLNALACVTLGLSLEIDFATIQRSLLTFEGVKRRFQIKGRVGDIMVVDDYGHHPTEITATLKTAKSMHKHRVITVFQPHRYTRTKYLMEHFIESLLISDEIVVTDIYAASEAPMPGVSAEDLCFRLHQEGKAEAFYFPKDKIIDFLLEHVRSGDLILTLGAGDIYRIGEELLEKLAKKFNGKVEMAGNEIHG